MSHGHPDARKFAKCSSLAEPLKKIDVPVRKKIKVCNHNIMQIFADIN